MAISLGKSEIDEDSGCLIPSIEVADLTAAQSLIAGSNAFGTSAPVKIASQLESSELKALAYRKFGLKAHYGFITLRNRTISPATKLFMEHVRRIEEDVQKKSDAYREI